MTLNIKSTTLYLALIVQKALYIRQLTKDKVAPTWELLDKG